MPKGSQSGSGPGATRGASVTDQLRRLIQSGEIPPGTRLVQADLARRFGTSITPVREAFTVLSRQGLLRQDMRRSPVVVRPTLANMRDNLEIRLQLEPLAARRTAERIGADDIARIEEILKVPNPKGNVVIHHDIDRAFHAAINELNGNPQLAEIIAGLRDSAYVFLHFDGPRPTVWQVEQIGLEHAAIVDALRDGDPSAAERAMARHLQAVARRSLGSLA